jgi:catechol 2,3-dioxygenase-like lactoylglutathione lyase family enzyme
MDTAVATLKNLDAKAGQRYAATDNQFGFRGLDHFALETMNIEILERFIREVLGGKPYYYAGFDADDRSSGRVPHVFLRVGSVLMQCAQSKSGKTNVRKDDPNIGPHIGLLVSAEDLDANVARLRKLGIPVAGPVRHRGVDVVSAYFQTPEGHKLEICTWDPYPKERAPFGRIDWPSLAHSWPYTKQTT